MHNGKVDFLHGTTSGAWIPKTIGTQRGVRGVTTGKGVSWTAKSQLPKKQKHPFQISYLLLLKAKLYDYFSLLIARSVLGIVWHQIDDPITQAYLTSYSSSKNGVNHGSSLNVEWKLGLHTFQQVLMHGINKRNEIFMCILLSPRPKAASPGNKIHGSL